MDIKVLRKFTNLQTKFMFLCKIKDIMLSNNTTLFGQDAVILLRGTSVPEVKREGNTYRFLNRSISLPGGYSFEHSWSVELVMDESLSVYKTFAKWFYEVENLGRVYNMQTKGTTGNYVTDALVQLMSLDGKKTNSVFGLINIYPASIPAIDDLKYDDTSGHITMKFDFYVDAVIHGTLNDNKIEWFEKDVVNFPYDTGINERDLMNGVNNYLTAV